MVLSIPSSEASPLAAGPSYNTPNDLTFEATMDQVLKARKMGSATARRKRIQERQEQQALEREKFQEHKRRILMYDHRADRLSARTDNLEDASDDDTDTEVVRSDRDSLAESQSERSALTPDDTLQNRVKFGGLVAGDAQTPLTLKIQIPSDDSIFPELDLDDDRIAIPPSPKPILQASLATLSDFRYDRYSTILDSPLSETLSPEVDTDETFSPIQTATPISYQQPKSRPSLISILSTSYQSKRRTGSLQSPLSQTISQTADRPTKRQSTTSVRSPFPAAEATLFEIPSLPDNAFELIVNASQESLPLSTKEYPISRAERKSSMPRLSLALNHARMSSIKSLIKTPTSSTPTTNYRKSISRPSSHMSRPSTASIPSSLQRDSIASDSTSNLGSVLRPTTSHNSSGSRTQEPSHNMTALPSLPTPPADNDEDDAFMAAKPAMSRKKSFSTLRRRSESIGQAIKGLGKITTKHDAPVPAMPNMTPRHAQTFDLSSATTPPLPSPPLRMSSAGSITSVQTSSSGGYFGLGLRSIDRLQSR